MKSLQKGERYSISHYPLNLSFYSGSPHQADKIARCIEMSAAAESVMGNEPGKTGHANRSLDSIEGVGGAGLGNTG
jgi:hypothetical protein